MKITDKKRSQKNFMGSNFPVGQLSGGGGGGKYFGGIFLGSIFPRTIEYILN